MRKQERNVYGLYSLNTLEIFPTNLIQWIHFMTLNFKSLHSKFSGVSKLLGTKCLIFKPYNRFIHTNDAIHS